MNTAIRHTAVGAALLLASAPARGDIEVQAGRVIGERLGSDPVMIAADPFHKFDPMGGTRVLDRVEIAVQYDWECVLQLANPLPVYQAVTYIAPEVWSGLVTNAGPSLMLYLWHSPSGQFGADPFQTAQMIETASGGTHYNIDPKDPHYLASFVGPGPLEVTNFDIGTSFDTFRLINGLRIGGPTGFSRFRERWTADLVYTFHYTVVPAPPACIGLLGGLIAGSTRRRR